MLFEKLSQADKNLTYQWICNYAGGPTNRSERAPLSDLLSHWDTNKVDLWKLFGGEFILQKSVLFEKNKQDLQNEIYSACRGYGEEDNMQEFYRAFWDWYWNLDSSVRTWRIERLVDCEILACNEYDGETFEVPMPDGKSLRVQKGTKPLRILAKIAKAYNLAGFEEFRLAHSRVLNQKKLSGELCLSIHTMDYMTMSDNDCDWDSCMSWRNDGCYRRGTVEMMNSRFVVVAYLRAKNDMQFYGGETWNNKKWRTLLIVDADCIASVKGYPYQSEELTKLCIEWLSELAERNVGWKFNNTTHAYDYYDHITDNGVDHKVEFSTYFMYNDFDSCTHYIRFGEHAPSYISINYSGAATCMFCGQVEDFDDDDEAETLVCSRCWDFAYCAHCDCRYDREDMYYLDGEYICEYCYDERTENDAITGALHLEENMSRLYLAKDHNEPDYSSDEYISVYMPQFYHDEEKVKKYFPNIDKDTVSHYGIFHSGIYYYTTMYYVRVDECSKEGLALFGMNDAEILEDYVGSAPNSLKDWIHSMFIRVQADNTAPEVLPAN
jgi:hypothetical protein